LPCMQDGWLLSCLPLSQVPALKVHWEKNMGDDYPKVRVAVVQAAPVFLNREASAEKAIRFIEEAGERGVDLLAFPEGFIPAHPVWYHFHPATGPESLQMATELFKNSVEVPGPTVDALCQAAQRAGTNVVIGVCEKRPATTRTMYNTQLFIGPDGRILGKRRKLVPTSHERMVWGRGHAEEQLYHLADAWSITLFILGHELVEAGYGIREPNTIILNSDHARACALIVDLAEEPEIESLQQRIVPLATVD